MLALVATLGIGGCVAAAVAATARDEIVKKDGTVLQGEVLETRDGSLYVLLEDGKMVKIPLEDIASVDRASALARKSGPREYSRFGAGGGLNISPALTGGVFRLKIPGKIVHHVDVRGGVGLGWTGSELYPMVVASPKVSFAGNIPVHPTLSVWTGAVFGEGPFVGAGTGIDIDTRGPFEAHFGFMTGGGDVLVFAADMGVGFVW